MMLYFYIVLTLFCNQFNWCVKASAFSSTSSMFAPQYTFPTTFTPVFVPSYQTVSGSEDATLGLPLNLSIIIKEYDHD